MQNILNNPMTLHEFLRQIDHKRVVEDLTCRYHHKVVYKKSRDILKALSLDSPVYAFAYNRGCGIVCYYKDKKIKSYSVNFNAFPDPERERTFVWSRMKNSTALTVIKENSWLESCIGDNVDYTDYDRQRHWPIVAEGEIRCRNVYLDAYYDYDYTVKRLKSGRLRVEVDNSYCPALTFAQALIFFEQRKDFSETPLEKLPTIFYGYKIISISELDLKIALELKAQGVADKLCQY